MASAIAARQDESEVSRRKLVEKSKAFKRTTSEEVRHQVSSLMKAFQSEVGVIRIRQDHKCGILNNYTYVVIAYRTAKDPIVPGVGTV